MDCIFCKIGKKEIESYIVSETENFLAFLDIHPLTPGHTIIIPKMHIIDFFDLDENFGNEFVKIIKETINKIKNGLGVKDFTIGINEGKLAGRAIDHLHLHIIPRYKGDNGGSLHRIVHYKTDENLESIYKKIKNAS
ncbi:MAG: HIT family protein [Minisyncoccia bacterium]